MQLFVATVTPFDASGKVDLGRLAAHIYWLCTRGVDGFIPTATSGEFLYLSEAEREAVMRTVLEAARGRLVYPCTWHPSPAITRYLTATARDLGASGVLLPPPLYYDLDEAALEAAYRDYSADAGLPVLAYHQPGRVPSSLSYEQYGRMRRTGALDGMLDSSADVYRLQRLSESDPGAIYASDDRILHAASKIRFLGGFVSAMANAYPDFVVRVFKQRESQLDEAVLDRANKIRAAGGLRAIKAVLGMGHRAPMISPSAEQLAGLPAAERP